MPEPTDHRDHPHVVQIAVPAPLRRVFDYRCAAHIPPGARVKVPFGRRNVIGVAVSNQPADGARPLKPIIEVLDPDNLFGECLLDLLNWASQYYHHPLGEVLQAALPVALRQHKPLIDPTASRCIRALERRGHEHERALERAPAQARLYEHLVDAGWVEASTLKAQFPDYAATMRKLHDKGLVEIAMRCAPPPAFSPTPSEVALNPEQQHAVDAIAASSGRFGSFLLHGITGSGKTEVYLEAAQRCIASGSQVLILVPEIALTPQLVTRVRARLGGGVCVLHSGLSAGKRYRAWWRARSGHAVAVLGTRSAVFAPLKSPGMIIIDEEHDISYKQREGFRYHARDLAIKRASMENIPIVLGSATPSMETHHNVAQGRHQLLVLTKRIGAATLPRIEFIDLKQHRPTEGISAPLLRAIEARLAKREQCIVFLNRRGFAPLAQCHACGWQVGCDRCDARMTYHRDTERLQCHHCGRVIKAEMVCGACAEPLALIGAGTQRVERYLKEKFPTIRISRLDRDEITTQAKLERELDAIQRGDTDIIVGTQLISKGHDFPRVTLVGVINSDQGLYSIDFRAAEYLFQQLTQVSGRAGRATSPGEVLIQTANPQHPTLQTMRQHDFENFAQQCLDERRAANYPPFSHIVLWRAESTDKTSALKFLEYTSAIGKRIATQRGIKQVQIMDAVISPMEKLAGRYRAQLMVRGNQRGELHQLLREWIAAIETSQQSRRARWSIDIDPMEMF